MACTQGQCTGRNVAVSAIAMDSPGTLYGFIYAAMIGSRMVSIGTATAVATLVGDGTPFPERVNRAAFDRNDRRWVVTLDDLQLDDACDEAAQTTGGDSTGGDSTGGDSTGGEPTGGEPTGEPTASDSANDTSGGTGVSDSGTGAGETGGTPTTSAGEPVDTTTADASDNSSGSGSGTAGEGDGGGCGCQQERGGGLLALFGFTLLTRRRR